MTEPAVQNISCAGVFGLGVIGSAMAACFLAAGVDVVGTCGPDEDQHDLTESIIRAALDYRQLTVQTSGTVGDLRVVRSVAQAAAAADFIQENIPEDRELKARVIAEIDTAARPGVVIASSTSGIRPTELQAMCTTDPGRVLVGHPFHPAHIIPLIEVVPGSQTRPDAAEQAMAVYRRIGKKPILVRAEIPGHVTNRLQAAIWREAYSLIDRGIVTVADIDTAIASGPGLRWAIVGPIAGQHLSGGRGGLRAVLDHLGPPAQEWMDDLGAPQLTPELVDKLVTGTDDEMAGIDPELLATERDQLLVDIIRLKQRARSLPETARARETTL
ncbi:3-hydroxyacyl-CoA dehydrogenase NAD-binding domain-containing protein [Mycolicibacterium sp. 120266]|uniref:3-hydroxyacyl-CoA dehydrogenase NAD-binding domain-containing protein n=1 Tax=Mycolicibacterium sp. 120266 TaxID=3090601 RepID=UPI00299EE24A|nr:3-hydroxyacyl-CoA dehydrogenase NAD-binding domain-containing protein [Mycolicibacterium sp. 120266]MDX1876173.1 3-hydroxyacyl-CoA dehydrogenase NAD-binding domain-containing protein [Mycolicibacterium sp. 120266]